MSGDKRLRRLAVAHLTIGLVSGILAPVRLRPPMELDRILIVPLLASVFCQAFILALWGVTSTASQWKRIAALLAGSVYLETLWLLALDGALLGIATVTIAVTTASLLVVRAKGVRVTRQVHNDPPGQPETERLRFSIRGLMLLTAAIALLSAVARAFQGLPSPEHRLHPLNVFLSLCFVTIGFVALWAVLGKAQPLARGAVLFVLSPILGVFFAIAANAHRAGWFYVILSMLLYSAALLASLLVVRSCGYRFMRCGVMFTEPPSNEENASATIPVTHSSDKSP